LKSKIVTISFLATFALNDARADTSSCWSQKESLTRGKLMLQCDLADVRVRRKALDEGGWGVEPDAVTSEEDVAESSTPDQSANATPILDVTP